MSPNQPAACGLFCVCVAPVATAASASTQLSPPINHGVSKKYHARNHVCVDKINHGRDNSSIDAHNAMENEMGYMGTALELAIDQFAADQDDGFDEYVERIEADLIATTEKALTLVQWMDKEVPTGHVYNGKTTERTDALINVFVNVLEVDSVANVLQALIASPAGAAVRKAIAEAHASVNASLIAEARVK